MGVAINEGKLNLPGPERIAGTNVDFPYVFVGYEAFPLKENLMKPSPEGNDSYTGKNIQLSIIASEKNY